MGSGSVPSLGFMAKKTGWARKIRRFVGTLLVAGAVAVGAVGYVVYREISKDLPPVDQLMSYQPPTTTQVFSEDGTMLGEFYVERRYVVPLERVPTHVRQAFLAAEDADFYRHPGVDPFGIARAFITNVANKRVVQGGSTITQQVVKTLLLTPERRFERKLKEVILSLRLENKLSKDDILYLYLNQIYFGAGAYGVQAAARTFFDVDVEDLTIAQAALLAGLPQRPTEYDPQKRLKAAKARQHYVLGRMRIENFITEEEYQEALAEEIDIAPPHRTTTTYTAAPWYVEHVRRLLEEHYGGTAAAQLGLRVYTAVDLQMQQMAEESLQQGVRNLDKQMGFRSSMRHVSPHKLDAFLKREAQVGSADGPYLNAVVTEVGKNGLKVRTGWETADVPAKALQIGARHLLPSAFRPGDIVTVTGREVGDNHTVHFALDQDPQLEGALVVIDPYTGQVKAIVGGYSFERSQFNRVTQARRQTGSAIKPLIYAAAFNRGYSPKSVVLDAPISFPGGPGGKRWTPKNFGRHYNGPVQLRTALMFSLNTVTVRLVKGIGLDYTRDFLGRFGFARPFPRHLALALGAVEVTPLELVRAYGIFPALGKRFDTIFITNVTDRDGNQVDYPGTRPHFERILDAEKAYELTTMLQGVVEHGTAAGHANIGRPAAGKTGTTNDMHDAWFVGFTPDLLAGVWVGYDSERSLGSWATGGHAAAPIWASFMRKALEGRPEVRFPTPSGVHVASAGLSTSDDDEDSKPRTRHLRRLSERADRATHHARRAARQSDTDESGDDYAPSGHRGADEGGF
jgi:penicillin-binding protein 1A